MPVRSFFLALGIVGVLLGAISCAPNGDIEAPTASFENDIGIFIYKIKAECQVKPYTRIQSGSRIRGYSGIVTALHGVVGCAGIVATSSSQALEADLRTFVDLEIIRVDIAHDIALLAPKEEVERTRLSPSEGLTPVTSLPLTGDSCDSPTGIDIFLMGYPTPYDDKITRSGTVVCRVSLKKRVPPMHPQRSKLDERNSPELATYVLDVDIAATHGNSGGPLLVRYENPKYGLSPGSVAGIVIGGLPDTSIPNAWAIPWPEVDLIPVELVRTRLDELGKRLLPEAVMAYLETEVPPLTYESNIVASDNIWDGSYTIDVDMVEVYDHDAWLAIFSADSDPYSDEPLAMALIPAPYFNPVKLYIMDDGNNTSVITKVETSLVTNGKIQLTAYLFSDSPPAGQFTLGDELITLANGSIGDNFWLKQGVK